MNYLNNDEWLDGYETEISLFDNQEEGIKYETEYETDNYNSDYETDDEFINIISGKDKLIDILFKKIINLKGDNNILFKIKCSFLYYITEKDESKKLKIYNYINKLIDDNKLICNKKLLINKINFDKIIDLIEIKENKPKLKEINNEIQHFFN